MEILIIGLLLFFGIHLVPAFEETRAALISKLGEGGYKGVFSVISFAGLGLMIWGYSQTPHYTVYSPPAWGYYLTLVAMVLSLIILAGAHMKGSIRKFLKDPMAVGVALWSVGHLFSNGDWASLLVFGSFLAYALLDIFTDNERVPYPEFEVRPRHDLIAVAAGIIVYLVLVFAHPWLFGVPVYG